MSRAVVGAVGSLLLVALARTAVAGDVTFAAARADGAAGEVVVVPLVVEAGADVSALQGGLAYDPAHLEVVDVVGGPALPEGARADFNADERGWLRLGFVCSPSKAAFRGGGDALRVRFRVKGPVGTETTLTLDRVRAWQPDDVEHHVVVRPGAVRIVAASGPGWAPFAALGGVLLFLLLLLLGRRRRRPAPPPAPTRSPAGLASPRGGSGRPRFCPACGAAVASPKARFCGECGEAL